jgi:hypothetical protein
VYRIGIGTLLAPNECLILYEKKGIKMANQNMELESIALAKVVGGAPHGFGVWIDGKFHRVDIGALGTLIVRLNEELEAARKELMACQATRSPQQNLRLVGNS